MATQPLLFAAGSKDLSPFDMQSLGIGVPGEQPSCKAPCPSEGAVAVTRTMTVERRGARYLIRVRVRAVQPCGPPAKRKRAGGGAAAAEETSMSRIRLTTSVEFDAPLVCPPGTKTEGKITVTVTLTGAKEDVRTRHEYEKREGKGRSQTPATTESKRQREQREAAVREARGALRSFLLVRPEATLCPPGCAFEWAMKLDGDGLPSPYLKESSSSLEKGIQTVVYVFLAQFRCAGERRGRIAEPPRYASLARLRGVDATHAGGMAGWSPFSGTRAPIATALPPPEILALAEATFGGRGIDWVRGP
ncbi:MAG: hypothetical protein ACT4PV_15405 [Planctomycetaceae bacterium]